MIPLLLIEAGVMLGIYVYHRLFDPPPPEPRPIHQLKVPRTDEGAVIPLVYGKCRVMAPVLAWTSLPAAVRMTNADGSPASLAYSTDVSPAPFLYTLNMFFVIGIPFRNGLNRIHGLWIGDVHVPEFPLLGATPSSPLNTLTGAGGTLDASGFHVGPFALVSTQSILNAHDSPSASFLAAGGIEFFNGNTEQVLVDQTTHVPNTRAGWWMMNERDVPLGIGEIPGYRGYMCAFLYSLDSDFTFDGGGHLVPIGKHPESSLAGVPRWAIGTDPSVAPYSMEVSSYPEEGVEWRYDGSLAVQIGDDANPIDVIYDLLTGTFGKLGIDPNLVDDVSFGAAAKTLALEEHGYSRSFEEAIDGASAIMEILAQIDAVMYEDPVDSKIKIRLIRADYDPAKCLQVNPSNCEELKNFASGGMTNIPNKIRVTFNNRDRDYASDSATVMDQANAVGQDQIVREIVVNYPGVRTATLAQTIAGRELDARGRPITKCSAVVDRSFLRVVQGDVVALTWPEYNISNMMMRVGNVTRGTLADGRIVLDLIQDMYYVHRLAHPPGRRGTVGFGGGSGDLAGG